MLLCTICSLEASLKFKLASETSKAALQRDRIQQLQNDLIKVRKCMFTNEIIHFGVYVVFIKFTVPCRRMTVRWSY